MVVTNIGEWEAGRLIEWHRGKAKRIEGVRGAEERIGCGGDAIKVLWRQCGMTTDGGRCLQRADSAEGVEAAGGVADGMYEAIVILDLQYGETLGVSCTADGVVGG